MHTINFMISMFSKPRVVISKCIEFEPVRYNGLKISSDFVKELINYIEPITVCPEVGIDLGVPRDTLKLVQIGKDVRLIQPKTRLDLTNEMINFADGFFSSIGEVDGFIMRSSSPSSGITRVKIYSKIEKSPMIRYGSGIFGSMVKERYGHLAVEEDLRLKEGNIREHFLRKLFILTDFRITKQERSMKRLVDFHTRNKIQLKAYNEKRMRELGRIVANQKRLDVEKLYSQYEETLYLALKRAARCSSYVNALMNALGYFSKEITNKEKQFFLHQLERFRGGAIPLVVPVDIMRSWIMRTGNEYLGKQTFFNPYPEELMDIESIVWACGNRDYWKNI
jgi:uncharacterized protein YbgA (DUF1722 family)/uncharacterized protein YbbK (DUF523 family)